MYVIGRNDFDFIKVTKSETMYDGQKYWTEVTGLEYEVPLHKATILSDFEKTKKLLEKIQNNVENITFTNNNIFGEIIDKETYFDKFSYSKELKIFELVPIVVNE